MIIYPRLPRLLEIANACIFCLFEVFRKIGKAHTVVVSTEDPGIISIHWSLYNWFFSVSVYQCAEFPHQQVFVVCFYWSAGGFQSGMVSYTSKMIMVLVPENL